MDYKITLFLTAIDKFKIFLFLSFLYLPFLFIGIYLNRKKIINKFLVIPFSFVLSNCFYGILIYFFSFFNFKINQINYLIIYLLFFLYFLNLYFLFKFKSKIKGLLSLFFNYKNLLFFLYVFILFISYFSIPSFPAGDAVLHISKINHILNNGFNFFSPFNKGQLDIGYLTNPTYFILSLISYNIKFTPLAVWSFSLVFYLLIDFFVLTGFLYWLFKNKLVAYNLSFFYFLIFRQGISALTFPYPNNQINASFLFLIIFLINYLKENNKNILNTYLILIFLSLIAYQMTHLAMSSLIFFIIISILILYLILFKILKSKIDLKKIIKLILIILLGLFPLVFYVLFLLFKLKFNQSSLISVSDKIDPFILDLYNNNYSRFDLKNIYFYFKEINFLDDKGRYFFGSWYFIELISYFLVILFSFKNKLFNLFYFVCFSLILNILIFNFGFITQKILPLWLLMRIDQSNFIIFIAVFLFLWFLFEKLDSKNGLRIFIFLLIFLNFSNIFKIQASRDYSRRLNSGYQECEFFWQKVSKDFNLNGKIYIYEGCEESQYLINTQTINSRYSLNYGDKKQLDQLFRELKLKKTSFKKENLNKHISKANLDFIIIRPCEKEFLKVLKNNIDYKKVFNNFEPDKNFCVFKIK